jgi:hypothetical protein
MGGGAAGDLFLVGGIKTHELVLARPRCGRVAPRLAVDPGHDEVERLISWTAGIDPTRHRERPLRASGRGDGRFARSSDFPACHRLDGQRGAQLVVPRSLEAHRFTLTLGGSLAVLGLMRCQPGDGTGGQAAHLLTG